VICIVHNQRTMTSIYLIYLNIDKLKGHSPTSIHLRECSEWAFTRRQSSVLNQTSIPTSTWRLLLTSSGVQRNFAWLAGALRIALRPTFRGHTVLKRNHASQPDHPAVHVVASSSTMNHTIQKYRPKSFYHPFQKMGRDLSVLHTTFSVEVW